MTTSFEVQEVSRYYQDFCALAQTSFSLSSGEVVVISGQNGSGKTTLLHCLTGLLLPSSGKIRVNGFDLYKDEVQAKKHLAFVPDIPRFYTELTAWEHLKFIALAHDAQAGFEQRAEELLKELGLWTARDLFPHNYSRGMRLKLCLALALIRPFDVLLMDEPTSALDPESVTYLVNKLHQLTEQGNCILFSSHNMDIIKPLGAKQWVMEQGRLHQ
jgi:ABC-2 type transport system ATP-binding protein